MTRILLGFVLGLITLPFASTMASVEVYHYANANDTMQIYSLDDDLLLFQYKQGKHSKLTSIPPSPFVQKVQFQGPSAYRSLPNGFQTKNIKVVVYQQSLCVRVYDLKQKSNLTKICPHHLDHHIKSIRMDPAGLSHAYGLGQQFIKPGQTDGDWVVHGLRDTGPFGNTLEVFDGGFVGNLQIPVMYALGKDLKNFGVFVTNPQKQKWVFSKEVWRAQVNGGDQISFYFMRGKNLSSLRKTYMELTGKPPVPPKKMMGVWISDTAVGSWKDVDTASQDMRKQNIPFEGFVLSNKWFGGVQEASPKTYMGRMAWDDRNFPNAKEKLRTYSDQHIGFVLMETPYVGTDLYRQQKNFHQYMVNDKDGKPVYLDYDPWWGVGSMLDVTNPKVNQAWFDWKRKPLIESGVLGFACEMGEPAQFAEDIAVYHGDKAHIDVHNVFGFKWMQGIYDGFEQNDLTQRPFILSRSVSPGSQRHGVALRSGNIMASKASFESHLQTQMHVHLSGIDYYGSDVGGYDRRFWAEQDENYDMLYSWWLANAAWTDIPLRPHGLNIKGTYPSAPSMVGVTSANRHAIDTRYVLLPYYYSLAHEAYRKGASVISPMVMFDQADPYLRTIGSQVMIGPWIMVKHVMLPETSEVSMYVPKGSWRNFYDDVWLDQTTPGVVNLELNLKKDRMELPVWIHEGAIIPTYIFETDKDEVKHALSEFDVQWRILPSAKQTTFTWYEDDGTTNAYQKTDAYQAIQVSQIKEKDRIVIAFTPKHVQFDTSKMNHTIRVMMKDVRDYREVTLDGQPFDRKAVKSRGSNEVWIEVGQLNTKEPTRIVLKKD